MAQLADSDNHSSTRLTVDVKEYFLHIAKPVSLWQKLLFSFMLADVRESLESAGSPSWCGHDTSNNQKLFPCGWADRQTDRIYLQGRNLSETVTAALRDWCGEVLGFHGSPGVCRGRIALHQCRMRGGQSNSARNKPSISIFCFFPGSKPSPLGAFAGRHSKQWDYLISFFLLVCVFWEL